MNQKEYYRIAHEASLDNTHPAIIEISKIALKSKKVLDMGCGDGTRLDLLKTKAEKVGVDINDYAIGEARKKYPTAEFIKGDIERLTLLKKSFDLVYSMFVLEHVENPEKVIKEAVRVLKNGGTLILVAPNFGAPNRRSPNSKEDKLAKLSQMFINHNGKSLDWTKVEPQKGKYFIDSDTRVEPYLVSLVAYLKHLGVKIVKVSSLWKLNTFSINQIIFKVLGDLGISPFVWWVPQIFVVAKKIE